MRFKNVFRKKTEDTELIGYSSDSCEYIRFDNDNDTDSKKNIICEYCKRKETNYKSVCCHREVHIECFVDNSYSSFNDGLMKCYLCKKKITIQSLINSIPSNMKKIFSKYVDLKTSMAFDLLKKIDTTYIKSLENLKVDLEKLKKSKEVVEHVKGNAIDVMSLFKFFFHLKNNKRIDKIKMFPYIHKLEEMTIYNSLSNDKKMRYDLFD